MKFALKQTKMDIPKSDTIQYTYLFPTSFIEHISFFLIPTKVFGVTAPDTTTPGSIKSILINTLKYISFGNRIIIYIEVISWVDLYMILIHS